ncbi:MAG: YitT family protein [Clostridiales bacterium]|nr:YitT family protein [Clostridiales bacterium]
MKRKKKRKTNLLIKELSELNPLHFLFLTIAGVINAFGVTLFLFPVKLYDSGISGLSMLLDQVTPPALTLSVFLLVLNVPVFLFGLKKQGLVFTIYSLYAVSVYSLVSFLIMHVLPINLNFVSPLAGSDLLLCAVFGGLISGIGSGLTIRFGGAIDGIDILSVIFAKKIGISIGSFVMIFNTILYIICGIVVKSWILPLYSIVTYFIGSKTVDFIVEGFDRSMCAMIVTNKAPEISDALSENFKASGTIVNAIGGYTRDEKQIIYFIVNHFQISKLKTIVTDIDNKAFISLQDVSDIVKHST